MCTVVAKSNMFWDANSCLQLFVRKFLGKRLLQMLISGLCGKGGMLTVTRVGVRFQCSAYDNLVVLKDRIIFFNNCEM